MPKPAISERFEKLLHTHSEADFFLILTGSIAGDIDSVYDEEHGFGI